MDAICKHTRSELIARRDGVDYVRCLDCDQICEAEDLEAVPLYEDEEEDVPRTNGKPHGALKKTGSKGR